VEWVRDQLSIRVKNIHDIDELNRDWLQDVSTGNNTTYASSSGSSSSSRDVKVLLLTHLLHPPLFLAALSIKFTGRIKFGMFSVKKEDSEAVRKKLKLLDHRIPSYLIITPEQKVVYGRRRFEHFNFASMNLFLRAVQPEMNDVFLCSLILVNMLVSMQIFQVRTYT
jgi:E3 ubiquitin-protein ligase RNF103